MAEFRFTGTSGSGQTVQGTVYAPNKKAASQKVESLSEKHAFALRDLEERMLFRYKVKHPSGKEVKGEQKAYAEDEIRSALERMGLEVVAVRKALFNYQSKPATGDVIMFVRLAANLLMEKMAFTEVMNLLMADISSNSLKAVLRDINSDLKGGMEAKQAFMKHQDKLGTFTAYMLGVASTSGNMAEIYESTARFLERKDEFRKSVRSALISPAMTIVATIGVFIWYVWSIVPQTAGLFASFEGIELPPLTTFSLAFSAFLDEWIGVLAVVLLAVVVGLVAYFRSPKGQFMAAKYMIRIPVVGPLLHKLNIEVFARVFAILYSGSGENLDVIKVAAEACGNRYMEHQIKTITIPMMMGQGTDLVKAMDAAQVFTPMTLSRFKTGAETGAVRKSAQQMADYYERETTLKLKAAVETIQTFVGLFIGLMVGFLTVLSAETAMIRPSSSDLMGM
ncbi:type II secretion system F family protein [Rubrivirga sp. S365]|uniref:Type II secretion system F family protein n=1 Tax=Rubrivirga litoralis TaxID=3075598 RepID=A0ABU3BV46_9BACT|nr:MULTISPECIES: type II secretion system F family protein [unclassified Rubrivirga]MDT0633162.1 type II secretion system F family protein [Rubrivirga sp. F394]MDT7857769.1 type II secretion system F family protein [Rubrivirga sp. S365]